MSDNVGKIKDNIIYNTFLHGPNWALPFHIYFDASDTSSGVVLGQQEGHKPYDIYYISKSLALAELKYTITEKEFLSFVYWINKFRHYITGHPTFVHTEHSAIKYLMNKPITNARVTIWLLLL